MALQAHTDPGAGLGQIHKFRTLQTDRLGALDATPVTLGTTDGTAFGATAPRRTKTTTIVRITLLFANGID